MKIAFTGTIFFNQRVGGISRYYSMLAKNINQSCKIFSPINKNNYLKDVSNQKKISFYVKKFPNNNFTKKINEILSNYLIKKYNPDIVHETYYSSNIANLQKYKNVVTIYDLIHEKFIQDYNQQKLNEKKNIIQYVDHFICISNKTREDFIEYYNVPEEKVSVVYLGCDHFSKKKIIISKTIDNPYLLFIGSRKKYKNFKVLLESLPKLKIKNISLVCFGGEKFNKEDLQQNKSKVDIIHVNGNDDVLFNLITNALCFINPSLYEGFGIPNLEAMHLDCPIICSNTQVFKEICDNGALYFDPIDSESLANCIDMVIENNQLRADLKIRGKKRSEKFKWENCVNQTMNIYRKLI